MCVFSFFPKVAVTQQLVERGADADRVNVLSKTAFELAMQLKQRDIKAYLDSITTVRPQTGLAAISANTAQLHVYPAPTLTVAIVRGVMLRVKTQWNAIIGEILKFSAVSHVVLEFASSMTIFVFPHILDIFVLFSWKTHLSSVYKTLLIDLCHAGKHYNLSLPFSAF